MQPHAQLDGGAEFEILDHFPALELPADLLAAKHELPLHYGIAELEEDRLTLVKLPISVHTAYGVP